MRAIFLSILFLLLPLFYPVGYSALCKDKPQDFPDNLTGKWIRLDNMIVPHMEIRYNPEHECKDMVFKDYSGIFAGKNCYTAYKFATSSGSMEFDYVEIDKKNNQFSLRYTNTEMQDDKVVQVLKNGKYVPYDKNDAELFQASYAGKLSGYKYKLVYEKDWLERVIMRPTYIPKVDGYEIDDYMKVNLTGRANWNYVQLASPTILGNAPQDAKQYISQLFGRGVRLWHNEANFMNLNADNSIV